MDVKAPILPTAQHPDSGFGSSAHAFSGPVLIVEDNIIIAMDAEELVTALGATEVHIAATAEQGLKVLEHHDISAAILDFNLAAETSEPVADALLARGTRFVFATGYSGLEELPERFTGQILLQKPYTPHDVQEAFAGL